MGKQRKKIKGPWPLVLDLAKAFERVSLPAVWECATHFTFPTKILRVLFGYLEHERRVQFEGSVAEPLLHGHFSRVKVELLASNQNLHPAEVEGLC